MYIRKVGIKNIRAISEFAMEFPEGKEAGWHVLIGDNGTGKSTVLQAIAMGIMGDQVLRVDPYWESWVTKGQKNASIEVIYRREDKYDIEEPYRSRNEKITRFDLIQNGDTYEIKTAINWRKGNTTHKGKRFYCGFGSFRRFTGGRDLESGEDKMTPLTPFESLFKPEILLNASLAWIKDQYLRSLEKKAGAASNLHILKQFISSGELLPDGIVIDEINSDGVFLRTSDNMVLHISEFSDGIKSTLALTLELFRLLFTSYGTAEIEKSIQQTMVISVPGVMLIDEIDAHLHPTWQTRIGQWFTKYFPNIQFIVTTHSPLICRGCVNERGEINGTIWHLAAPGSGEESGLLSEADRDKLIYGNILDAYGTGAFGENIERTKAAQALLKELAQLDKLHTFGQISPEQDQRRLELQKIFTTDVITDF